ncbi:ATP-binding cassette sub-family B member 10, mitochondrial-like [Salvelinus alpinus]
MAGLAVIYGRYLHSISKRTQDSGRGHTVGRRAYQQHEDSLCVCALDAENEFLVQEALERLMDGRTVLIIAHRLTTIQNADAVAVLGQRCVVECGQHAQLLGNRQGLFRKLMEKQAFFQEGQKQALKRGQWSSLNVEKVPLQ